MCVVENLLQVENSGGDPLDAVHHPVGIRRPLAPHGDVLVEVELPPHCRVLRLDRDAESGWGWRSDLDATLTPPPSPFLEGADSGECDLWPPRQCLSVRRRWETLIFFTFKWKSICRKLTCNRWSGGGLQQVKPHYSIFGLLSLVIWLD